MPRSIWSWFGLGGAKPLAIEIKSGSAPVPTKGYWSALKDLDAEGMVVCQAQERFPLQEAVDAIPIEELAGALAAADRHSEDRPTRRGR